MTKNIIAILIAATALQASALTLKVVPGQLSDKLAGSVLDKELVIEGNTDARDLTVLRGVNSDVVTLDLSKANISELYSASPVYLGKSLFKANTLPSYILFQAPYKKVILPESVTAIESGALAGSGLEEIVIPEGVTSIGDYAFYGCVNLKSVVLPMSLKSIGRGAFAGCRSLEDINLYATALTELPDECFAETLSLRSLELPAVRSVGSRVFAGSAIESLSLPEVSEFAPFALADMPNLVMLKIGNGARFEVGTLMNCPSLMLLQGQPEAIPDLFAANCTALASDNMISGATSIGEYAVYNTTTPSMILGPGLMSIDKKAFAGAVNLTYIDATALEDTPPAIEEDSFEGIDPSKVKLKVADFKEDAWRNHPVWGQFDITSDNIVGVDEIQGEADAIRIRIEGRTLVVEAPSPIMSGAVYDTNGKMLLTLPAGETTASADLTALPSGIGVVSVKTADDFKGFKIIF